MDLRVKHEDDRVEMDSRIKSENDSDGVERPSSPRLVMPDPIGHPLEFNSVDLRVKHEDDNDGVE